jgi:membrane-associated phospholipid phosphatase
MIISLLLAGIIRIVYFKERPNKARHDTLFLRIYNSSFPSVHAMRAFILAFFFSQHYFSWILLIVTVSLAILVGYSRIFLKKHDFIDVIVGSILGIILAFFLI